MSLFLVINKAKDKLANENLMLKWILNSHLKTKKKQNNVAVGYVNLVRITFVTSDSICEEITQKEICGGNRMNE